MNIQELPGDSRIVKHYNNGRPRWDDETYLLSDLAHILSGKPHPARPKLTESGASRLDTPRRRQIMQRRAARMRAQRSREGQ